MYAIACIGLSACVATTSPDTSAYDIIPNPAKLEKQEGSFRIDAGTRIAVPPGDDWNNAAVFFKNLLSKSTGFNPEINQNTDNKNVIRIVQNEQIANPEGYALNITPDLITIDAKTAAGAFYAFQTLRQMLPVEVESNQKISDKAWIIPCANVEDAPRFGYRGMMLDVARHFFTVDEVKQFIDLIAMHKMNRFHWHLTDDQGWRIEIKKYPKLTEVGAWRNETLIGHYSARPRKFDTVRYGGFYTQEEIRDVVKYAQDRFIETVPEVDLPGHMSALLTAYPEYGCTGGPYKVKGDWGVFDDLLMPSEATFTLLDNIFAEVIELFPGKYIHIGGDEAVKNQWKKSPEVQAFIRKNKLKDEEEVQTYFTTRVAEFIRSKGREVIGWDEILEGGDLPTSTIIMSWRGVEGGIHAAKHGNQAIMTPTSYLYFDYYQSKNVNEPLAIGGHLTLEKVYSYEPIPSELTPEQAKLIMGVQGNLWTEYIGEYEKVLYMTLPRACALSEIQWMPANTRNYEEFVGRLTRMLKRFDAMGINYGKHVFEVKVSIETKLGENILTLTCSDAGSEIRYTVDGSTPSVQSELYKTPVSIKQNCTFKAQTFKDGLPSGSIYDQTFVMHKAVGTSVNLSPNPSKAYNPGSSGALVNGIEGNVKYNDNQWFGFAGSDVTAIIDFGNMQEITSVSTNFLQLPDAWIYAPKTVTVSISSDGNAFEQVSEAKPDETEGIVTVKIALQTQARYLKIEALNLGLIPADKPGQGHKAWTFIDEIIVD
jgi:hexosaminidase